MANLTFDFLHNYVTGERRASDPADAYQYDEGHVLEAVVPVAVTSCEIQYWIRGMEKADAYTPTSITQNTDNTYTILGNIPNSYFETNGDLRVYIVVTDGDASITTYEGYIHIKERQMPEDYVDDDPDNDAVQIIAAARGYAETSEAWAVGQINGEDVPSTADQYQNNASYYANQAASAASSAAAQASLAPAYDNTATYEVGDYSLYSGQLYECTTAITTAEAWTAAHWTAVTVGGELSNLKDDFHEYHSELGAGYADQLVSGIENTDSVPYNIRKVPYDATLEKVEGIVGVDVVVNQLCNGASVTVPNGHKYYMLKGGTASVGASTETAITGLTSGTDMVIDLTQTFGSQIADYVYSLEQSTAGAGAAWLKKNFSEIFDSGYIPHNPGEMVHVSGLSAHKMVGFNQWDEQWEVGGLDGDNGSTTTTETNKIRSKNYNQCLPNTQYYVQNGGSGTAYLFFYDANKGFISMNASSGNRVVTTPSNAHFFKIGMTSGYGTTYNHDICINLSDPAKNGQYEPYTEHTYPLDSTIDLHGILKLDSNNNLYADGDVYKPDGSVNRRYGVVDLGTLNWLKDTLGDKWAFYLNSGVLPDAKVVQSLYALPNFINTKYTIVQTYGYTDYNTEKIIYQKPNGQIFVVDSAYTDAASFKTAMSGVLLVYELATPTTETAEPYQQRQIIDADGTEEFVSTSVVPVGHITKYPENLRKKIEGLPWNFATLIAPTESTYKATRNYTTGSLFIVNNVLYKATANIANGGTITPNTNCTATTLAEVISALS